ncbi:MAG TPA: ACT domain-containing protein [Acidimicrobiia bacterium]|nr:ACT domain-containing protein [Acidimicrobiia bacterium]
MQCAISIFGKDCPGIIADITSVLVDNNVNIEDASMTILQGHFAMILVVRLPFESLDEVKTRLKQSESLQGFNISFSKSDSGPLEPTTEFADDVRYVLHLTVDDSPGIVSKITKVLGSHGANVVDCSTRKNNETQIFTMSLDVDVPNAQQKSIEDEIADISGEFSGDIVFRKLDSVDL